jgi:hypothetical protein
MSCESIYNSNPIYWVTLTLYYITLHYIILYYIILYYTAVEGIIVLLPLLGILICKKIHHMYKNNFIIKMLSTEV